MSLDPAGEQALIERARSGDTGAYDALVSHYLPRVISIARGIVRNVHDAEDLAQEAFVSAYRNIGRFRSGEPFGPWIFRIVTNRALDVVKHRTKFPSVELGPGDAAGRRDEADTEATANEIAGRIDRAIEELPEMQRLVARLHLIEELDHDEIAAITGLSQGTVRSHLSLARGKLKQKLADLYE
jgi:RNA polymerase sigma-70 factor (ECF subfamily)